MGGRVSAHPKCRTIDAVRLHGCQVHRSGQLGSRIDSRWTARRSRMFPGTREHSRPATDYRYPRRMGDLGIMGLYTYQSSQSISQTPPSNRLSLSSGLRRDERAAGLAAACIKARSMCRLFVTNLMNRTYPIGQFRCVRIVRLRHTYLRTAPHVWGADSLLVREVNMRNHLHRSAVGAIWGWRTWAAAADPALPPLPTTVSDAARAQLVAMAKGRFRSETPMR